MTDAERKTMTEKQDKKANEECYSFLKNIRDVRLHDILLRACAYCEVIL